MIQVENESGLLTDRRERSPQAQALWSDTVPAALVRHLGAALSHSSAQELWQQHGSRVVGTWAELFGSDWRAEEVFMAWDFATYVQRVAAAGLRIKNIPMYANAWLGPQPGQEIAGQYPSGGPASSVLDIWRADAPSLALLGPDIYVDDADGAMATYAQGQPLFVPECRLSAAELIRAVGTYGAIGRSGFGIDLANPQGQLATTLAY